jgi:hypothetical protein
MLMDAMAHLKKHLRLPWHNLIGTVGEVVDLLWDACQGSRARAGVPVPDSNVVMIHGQIVCRPDIWIGSYPRESHIPGHMRRSKTGIIARTSWVEFIHCAA